MDTNIPDSFPVYSICITHFNNVRTVRRALDSIIGQIDDRFEIVVVDNYSNDGSRQILEEYAKAGKINTLVEKHCSRGLGWQTALENAKGQYIVVDLDMDDDFKPELYSLLGFYHSKCEGYVLAAVADLGSSWSKNITIAPRSLAQELGGWPDLQLYEHSNVWGKAALRNLYKWTNFSLVTTIGEHPERDTWFGRFKFTYMRYRELLRQGRIAMVKGELHGVYGRSALLLAWISAHFLKSYAKTTNVAFRPRDQSYFVKFEGGP
jgi:glycosyltransferase involved in cell wall biosynthesis